MPHREPNLAQCSSISNWFVILSIAAAKLGYAPVIGFDFDPDAVRVAKENAAVNRVRIKISRQDLTRLQYGGHERFNVVCANSLTVCLFRSAEDSLPPGRRRHFGAGRDFAGAVYAVQKGLRRSRGEIVARRAVGEWKSGSFVARADSKRIRLFKADSACATDEQISAKLF